MENEENKENKENILVSVVVPVYNEERFIAQYMESLLKQDYPRMFSEWIFIDGMSSDRTVSILEDYKKNYPFIKILKNPDKTVPYAMNIGIAASKGQYIVRMDAHASYAPNYISMCVKYLSEVDADNVGGVAETKAKGFVGGCIAKVLSSKFGVGNSQFRTGGKDGYVDTVPFGAFKREVFSKYGGYDERLTRNQDNEMNYRIRKNGGKIYLTGNIQLSYYCRDSVKGISKMAMMNGKWNIITMKLCPGSMGLRHFIPFLFVLSTVLLSIFSFLHPIFLFGLLGEWGLYTLLNLFFSGKAAKSFKEFLMILFLFPLFHLSYGCGSFSGITKLFSKKYKKDGYEPKKI